MAENNDEAPLPVQLVVAYEFIDLEHTWKSERKDVPADATMEDVTTIVWDRLRVKVGKDRALLSHLRQHMANLSFTTEITFGDERDRYANADEWGVSHIELVSDLFVNPEKETSEIPITVKLQRVTAVAGETEGQVGVENGKMARRTYHRLGTFKPEARKGLIELQNIPACWTLLGWYSDDSNRNDFQISKVHTWSINGLSIGDCDHGGLLSRLPKSVKLDPTYQSDTAVSKQSIQKLLGAAGQQRTLDLEASVPVLPTYTFNNYDPEETTDHVGYPGRISKGILSAHIHVATRFIEQLGSSIEFPVDKVLIFTEDADHVEICQQLSAVIRGFRKGSNGEAPIRLLEEPLNGTWCWELWVLPQVHGWKKMFRFEHRTLKQFLDTQIVEAEGELQLYMEARVAPKVEHADQTGEDGPSKKRRKTVA